MDAKVRVPYTVQKTEPWSSDEFIHVDGQPRVYFFRDDVMHVAFPGMISRTVDHLKSVGINVRMPRIMRAESCRR